VDVPDVLETQNEIKKMLLANSGHIARMTTSTCHNDGVAALAGTDAERPPWRPRPKLSGQRFWISIDHTTLEHLFMTIPPFGKAATAPSSKVTHSKTSQKNKLASASSEAATATSRCAFVAKHNGSSKDRPGFETKASPITLPCGVDGLCRARFYGN
jgi:hypothetical protein